MSDINFFGLIGSLARLIFVFKFDYKKQEEASVKNFESEENKDVKLGFIITVLFFIWGILTYVL